MHIFTAMKTGYLIDMDGVIYRENRLIPGAADFVRALQATSVPFLFLTNNSAPTPEDLAVRLKHLGISGLSAKHFYTSALNTADFLSETHPGCTVFVIGEGGLLAALHERKIASDAIRPHYVVVGAGATTAYLEASSGRRAYYLGKPNGYMFHQARKKLAGLAGKDLQEVVMIGDTMETDIRGAFEAGIQAFLVLSGSTQFDSLGDYVYQPTRVLQTVGDLVQEISTGVPGDPLQIPALTQSGAHTTRAGLRHQTDIFAFHKPRPRPAMTK